MPNPDASLLSAYVRRDTASTRSCHGNPSHRVRAVDQLPLFIRRLSSGTAGRITQLYRREQIRMGEVLVACQ